MTIYSDYIGMLDDIINNLDTLLPRFTRLDADDVGSAETNFIQYVGRVKGNLQ
jgi:hypothetical protein